MLQALERESCNYAHSLSCVDHPDANLGSLGPHFLTWGGYQFQTSSGVTK